MSLSSTYEFDQYTSPTGVECVLVRMPHQQEPFYCIPLDHLLMAAQTGVGHRPPGALVCGYEYTEGSPGWILGYFPPRDLLHLWQEFREAMLRRKVQERKENETSPTS